MYKNIDNNKAQERVKRLELLKFWLMNHKVGLVNDWEFYNLFDRDLERVLPDIDYRQLISDNLKLEAAIYGTSH